VLGIMESRNQSSEGFMNILLAHWKQIASMAAVIAVISAIWFHGYISGSDAVKAEIAAKVQQNQQQVIEKERKDVETSNKIGFNLDSDLAILNSMYEADADTMPATDARVVVTNVCDNRERKRLQGIINQKTAIIHACGKQLGVVE